jgi:hypothetical protein
MDRNIRILTLAAMAATILMPVVSYAQAPPSTQTPISPKIEQLDPRACANSDTRATVGKGGDATIEQPNGSSLSDKLARSDGVICPPEHVDPEIKAVTPPGGPMPVIPPPGSPGGDPNVHPK